MNYNFPNLPALKLLIPFLSGLCLYSIIHSYSDLDHPLLGYLILTAILLCLGISVILQKAVAKSICILVTSFLIGIFTIHVDKQCDNEIRLSVPKNISVLKIKDKFISNDKLILTTKHIASGKALDTLYRDQGSVRIRTDSTDWQSWNENDLILCQGKIYPSNSISNPHAFNFGEYLIENEIYYNATIDKKDLIILEQDTIFSWTNSVRNYGQESLTKHIDDPIALDISNAMILGMKKEMDKSIKETFSDTGAIHVLAVSGLHVGIVAGMIYILFSIPILRRIRIIKIIKPIVVVAAIWAFAIITGSSPSVLRSAIMFTFLTLGLSFKRKGNSLNVLAATATGLLIFDPDYLTNLSFQLSFLALTGIILFFPHLKRYIHTPYRRINSITSLIGVSVAAQVMVAPISIYHFHQFPIYFIFSSLIAIPAAIACLNLGVLLFVTNLISALDTVSELIGNLLEFTLIALYNGLTFLESLPFAVSSGLQLSPLSVILLYGSIFSFFFYLQSKKAKYVIVGSLFLFAQIANHLWEDKCARDRSALFVYHDLKGSYVEVFKNGYSSWLYKDELPEHKRQYIDLSNKMENRIIQDTITKVFVIEKKDAFTSINNSILCLYPDSSILSTSCNKPIDLVTLSKSNQDLLPELSKSFKLKKVVLDGTIGNEKYYMRKQLKDEGIDYHITSIDGPYVMELE